MIVVKRATDMTLQSRPDVLDEIRGSEDELRVIAGDVSVAEERVDAGIAGGGVGEHRRASPDVFEEEPVGRLLFAVSCGTKHHELPASLVRAEHDALIAMSLTTEERLVDLDLSFENGTGIGEIVAETAEPAADGDPRKAGDLDRGSEGHFSLPADDQQPELFPGNFLSGKP